MADESLAWEMKIADLMSGPLGKIEGQIAGLEKAMGSLQKTSAKTDKALAVTGTISKALGDGKAKLLGARADFEKAWGALMSTGPGQRVSRVWDSLSAGASGMASRLSGPLGKAFDKIMGSSLVARAQGAFGKIGAFASGIGARLAPVFGPLGDGFEKLFGAAGNFGSALAAKVMPGLRSMATAIPGIVTGIGAMAAAMGVAAVALGAAAGKWALSGLSFNEDTKVAFKTLLGTQDGAERVFKWATKFAATTPFSSDEVVSSVQRFLTGGFKEDQLDTLMKAVGDVGANMGTEKMQQVSTAINQVKAKGKLQGEEMMQLAEGGVGQSAVFAAIAKNLGISEDSAKARVSGGQINGEQGVAAIIEAIRQTQSGGELGSAMGAKSQTLTGLFSTLKDIPSSMLFAAETGGATAPLKSMVKRISSYFEEGEPVFTKGVAMIERVSTAWGKAFDSMGGLDVEAILTGAIDAIERLGTAAAPFMGGLLSGLGGQLEKVFSGFGESDPEALKKMGETIGRNLGLVIHAGVAFGQLLFWLGEKMLWLMDHIPGMGGAVAKAFSSGNSAGLPTVDPATFRGDAPGGLVSGFAPPGAAAPQLVQPNVTSTVGEIRVYVNGDDDAAKKVAGQVQGGFVDMLTRTMREMGG